MHHGEFAESELMNELRSKLDEETTTKFGATGRFPEGKLQRDDQGEIQFGVACDPATRKVVIEFGTPVKWLATNAEQAIELGELLIRHGKRLKKS